MTKLEKVSKVTKNKYNKTLFLSSGKSVDISKYEKIKNDDCVFFEENDGKPKILDWKLYDCKELDIFFRNDKFNTFHYGLKIDKFSNIFKERVVKSFESKDTEVIHNNINEILKSDIDYYEDIDFKATLSDKLVVGLGGHSVFETDIKIHHTYGVPFIPGSAVKGCLKNYISKEFNSQGVDVEKEKWFNLIFGGTVDGENNRGNVIFLDAFPTNKFHVKGDIMTPHYKDIYQDDNPVIPIEFMVVKEVSFRFVIRIKKEKFICGDKDEVVIEIGDRKNVSVKEFIVKNLSDMIQYHGIGAKTAVGYGYFEELPEGKYLEISNRNIQRRDDEIKKLEIEKKLETMTESEKKVYLDKQIEDENQRIEEFKRLFALRDNENLDKKEIVELAEILKEDLEKNGEWKYNSKKKKNKSVKRIEEICTILEISIPR